MIGAVPWAVIFAYAGTTSKYTPAFVNGILASYLIFFTTFPLVSCFFFLVLRKGRRASHASHLLPLLHFPPPSDPQNMGLQYARIGPWSDKFWGYQKGGYYLGEIVYQFLSLFSKSLLLWLVVGGGNQPMNPNTK